MSLAWETTEEDILTCLFAMGKKDLMPEEVSEIHSNLDHHAIESSALLGGDFDEQVLFAYHEIKKQIRKMDF